MVINLLNRKQAAEYMGISVSALDRLRSMGELTAIQGVPNGRVLYREEELINFFARHSERKAKLRQEFAPTYRETRLARRRF